jgi:signal transduction histidine kinase
VSDEATHVARIAQLERKLSARDKTITVLMARVEGSMAAPDAPYAMFEQNIALEQIAMRRTRELERNHAQLEKALADLQFAQVELVEARKLEAIGQLAAGIAHEINTPTQYVMDNSSFVRESFLEITEVLTALQRLTVMQDAQPAEVVAQLQRELSRLDLDYLRQEIPAALDQSLGGLRQIANIVNAMKQFSHPGTATKELADMGEILNTVVMVTRNEWKYVCEVSVDVAPGMPMLPCLRSELSQVFVNLIVNSAHSIADKLKEEPAKKGSIRVAARCTGLAMEITLKDTGAGIPERIRTRVFDPFFTTKPVGKGTGQGLAIARSVIVDKHQGTIVFESEEGLGTTFVIRLPLADGRGPSKISRSAG